MAINKGGLNELLIKTYDEYKQDDYSFSEDTGDLNPKREITWDNFKKEYDNKSILDKIEARLQSLTDDIVRKRITPKAVEESLEGSFGGESVSKGQNIEKLAAINRVGSISSLFNITNDEFLEYRLATMPSTNTMDELDIPTVLDCGLILDIYNGTVGTDGSGENLEGSGNGGDSEGDNLAGTQGEGTPSTGVPAEDLNAGSDDGTGSSQTPENCADVELGILKIILVIIQVLTVIKKIITLTLSIVLTIVEIARLAVGAWLNPVNIAKISLEITQIVVSIAMQLLSYIIQLLWNLLNLDCLSAASLATINEFKQSMFAFSSIASSFNPTSVSFLGNTNVNPLDSLLDTLEQSGEDWKALGQQALGITGNDVKKAITDEFLSAFSNDIVNGSEGKKIQEIANATNNTFNLKNSALSAAIQSVSNQNKTIVSATSDTAEVKQLTNNQIASVSIQKREV